MGRRDDREDQAAAAAPATGYTGPGAGAYAARRKSRRADVYDRPAIERQADARDGQAPRRTRRPARGPRRWPA